MATTHPQNVAWRADRLSWAAELRQFCTATQFNGLRILASALGAERATVTFAASLTQHGRDASFTETSAFVLWQGRWLYLSGTVASGSL